MSDLITCPRCDQQFELTAALAAQLEGRVRDKLEADLSPVRDQLAKQETDLQKRQKEIQGERHKLKEQQEALVQAREEIEAKVREGLDAGKQKLLAKARQEATAEVAVQMQARQEQCEELERKVKEAQTQQVECLKKERALKQKTGELELQVSKQVNEQLDTARAEARQKSAEEHQLRHAEDQKKISDQLKLIEDMRRKMEQGSQQTQGEVLELALEKLLRERFMHDQIVEVRKGASGADLRQTVRTANGAECGVILWESKNTKSWDKKWLEKLRTDQSACQASATVIVTTALPPDTKHFDLIDGVWVTSWSCVTSVADAARVYVVEQARARRAIEGRAEKQAQLYQYLQGNGFHQHTQGMVDAIRAMLTDLQSERIALQKQWAKREKLIENALRNLACMYGDMQAIVGSGLPEIRGMTLLELEPPAPMPRLTQSG